MPAPACACMERNGTSAAADPGRRHGPGPRVPSIQVLHHHLYRPAEFTAYRQQTMTLEDTLAAAEAVLRAGHAQQREPDPSLDACVQHYTETLAQYATSARPARAFVVAGSPG